MPVVSKFSAIKTVMLYWGHYKLTPWLYTSVLGCYSGFEKRTLAWMFTEKIYSFTLLMLILTTAVKEKPHLIQLRLGISNKGREILA
jgi:glycerol uptake facilitator-like aquaporin